MVWPTPLTESGITPADIGDHPGATEGAVAEHYQIAKVVNDITVGPTQVDVHNGYGGDLLAAIAAAPGDGAGVQFNLTRPTVEVDDTIVIQTGMVLESHSKAGTTVRLADNADVTLLKTADFDTLNAGTTQAGPTKFELRHLTFDQNKAGNSAGKVAEFYASSYVIEDVDFMNGVDGGVYTNWGNGGEQIEARWMGFKIRNCQGAQLEVRGPTDSQFIGGVVELDSLNTAERGIYLPSTSSGGGYQFIGVHAYGPYTFATWDLCRHAELSNCVGEGGAVDLILGSFNIHGDIVLFGDNSGNGVGLQVGDVSRGFTAGECRLQVALRRYPAPGADIDFQQSNGSNVIIGAASDLATTGTINAGDLVLITAASNRIMHFPNIDRDFKVVSNSGTAFGVSSLSQALMNMSCSGKRLDMLNGTMIRMSSGNFTGTKIELDGNLGTVRTTGGATGARPSASTVGAGARWYDTTLGIPIFSNGTVWKDAMGTTV